MAGVPAQRPRLLDDRGAVPLRLQRVQQHLLLSLGFPAVGPSQAVNTAASFVTNTNWRSYSGEATTGHLVQMFGLTGTGRQALDVAVRTHPDIVIRDLGLPDLDGTDVIAGLRGWTPTPILVLSGRSDSADKVDALDAGADDDLTKPLAMDALLARLRALDRRVAPVGTEPVDRLGDVVVDLAATGSNAPGRRCASPRRSGRS